MSDQHQNPSWAKDKWKFYKDEDGLHRWHRTAINGISVGASCEGWVNLSDCEANAKRHGWNGETDN